MTPRCLLFTSSATLLVSLLFATLAHAEPLSLYLFQMGRPLADREIMLGEEILCKSNSLGECVAELPPGNYKLELRAGRLQVAPSSPPPAGSDARPVGVEPQPPFSIEEGQGLPVVAYVDWDLDSGEVRYTVDSGAASKPDVTSQEASGEVGSKTPVAFQGRVVSFQKGTPLGGVQVFVKGVDQQVRTDPSGAFELSLAPGRYALAFVHPEYSTHTETGVVVGAGDGSSTLVVRLSPLSIALDDVVVTAPHIQGSAAAFSELRRESLAVSDVLGAEEMSRNGDSNAASALRRVTGLTLLDGKYIYVRGLGERYSSTTLNGSALPSPEPTRRVVPLDIFPSGVLEGVIVQKTFTPDMPGEFGGGTLRLRTRGAREESFAKVSISTEIPTEKSSRLTSRGGGRDWSGLDDGTRALPREIRTSDRGPIDLGQSYSDAEVESFGESLRNAYSITKREPALMHSVPVSASAEMGTHAGWNEWGMGFFLSGLYSDKFEDSSRTLQRYNASNGKLGSVDKDLSYQASKRKLGAGGLGHLSLSYNKNQTLELVSLLTRKTTDTAQLKEGTTGGGDDTIRTSKVEWNERELSFNQLSGSHELLKTLSLGWRYSQSDARNYIPDSRSYRYELRGSDYLISNRSDGNSRSFTSLFDRGEDWGVDFSIVAKDSKDFVLRYKIGVSSFYKRRKFDTRRFHFRFPDFLEPELRKANPEDIFTAENIASDRFVLVETTRNTDTYAARQTIDAQYAMAEVSFRDWLSLVGGVRVEHSDQEVVTFSLHDAGQVPDSAKLMGIDALPAANLTVRLGRQFQMRGAYSETLSRPDFRELSTASYFDDRLDMEVQGFAGLRNSKLENIDARLEFYSSLGDRLSLGAFQKNIQKPIERILLNVAGNETKVSFRNSKRATNRGLELEFAAGLGRLANPLSPFTLTGNYSIIESNIVLDLSEIQSQVSLTSQERALQGVSPYTLNLGLFCEVESWGLQGNIVYNEIGRRITELGTNGMPDVYEDPVRTLDLILGQKPGAGVKISAKVKDILARDRITRQDGKVITREESSPTIALGLSAQF